METAREERTIDPCALLSHINRDLKQIGREAGAKHSLWHELDRFIPEMRSELDILWPDSVFMPFGLWPHFIETYLRLPPSTFDLKREMDRGMAQALSCLAPWRATQDIVRFDPDVERELLGMELAGKLPSEILKHLPAWCVYIDVPLKVDGDQYSGFFAQLDVLKDTLYLAMTFQGAGMLQQRIPLALGDFTLEESVEEVNRVSRMTRERLVAHDDKGLAQALNLVTYVCAYGVGNGEQKTTAPATKRVKTKKQWRIFPPDKPRVHTLGSDYGNEMRKRRNDSEGGWTVRPHLRRPHWHHFWTGGMRNRRLVVKWLPPIFVGNSERDETA